MRLACEQGMGGREVVGTRTQTGWIFFFSRDEGLLCEVGRFMIGRFDALGTTRSIMRS